MRELAFLRWGAAALLVLAVAGPAAAQNYVGDDNTCAFCHASGLPGVPQVDFDAYMDSGHPWKLHRTAGQVPAEDEWPHTPVPPLPTIGTQGEAGGTQLQWSDIEFVIGNFFWKTRFVDRDGYIITGTANDATQWNLATQEWVPYHAGEEHPYNCGRCHTTGYSPDGHQYDLPGVVGTWSQEGVHCEACHGPREGHPITPPGPGKECSDCHYRDDQFRMPWKSGFMRHHQQAEDLSHSPHKDLDCTACHDPHRSVVYDDGGVKTECTTCHDAQSHQVSIPAMANLECTDCHMPKMGKSAVAENEYKADIHGHLFRIMTDPVAAADNVYEDGGTLFWNQDQDGNAYITLDYACLGCHTDEDLQWASEHAEGMHEAAPPPPPAGDTWSIQLVMQNTTFTATFEPFGGYLTVDMEFEDGSTSNGIGIRMGEYILWIDLSGPIYYGWETSPTTMQGIKLGGPEGMDFWIAEHL